MKTKVRPEEKESSSPKRSALMVQNSFVSTEQAAFCKRSEGASEGQSRSHEILGRPPVPTGSNG